MRTIYLDYNATTPIAPAVQQAILPYLAEHYGNPSSNHLLGRAAHEAVEDGRMRVAQLLGVERDEIVFTASGTEANNLALKGVMLRKSLESRAHLVISAIEHPAVVEPARFLERLGFRMSIVPCDGRGVVDPDAVRRAIRPETALVSVMHANNEIGTLQPIRAISQICQEHGVLLHCDAAQSVGKISTRIAELGVDLLSIAGHKLYAPKGVGALYVRKGVMLEPLLHGAAHEGGTRAGTENVPYIAGLGVAAALALRHLSEAGERIALLRDRLWEQLSASIGEGFSFHGQGAARLPNTLSVNFPDVIGADLLRRCPELCASTGSACHSGTTHLSATLAAMGVKPDAARGTIRLSLGWYTSEEEIDRAASLLIAAWESLR